MNILRRENLDRSCWQTRADSAIEEKTLIPKQIKIKPWPASLHRSQLMFQVAGTNRNSARVTPTMPVAWGCMLSIYPHLTSHCSFTENILSNGITNCEKSDIQLSSIQSPRGSVAPKNFSKVVIYVWKIVSAMVVYFAPSITDISHFR